MPMNSKFHLTLETNDLVQLRLQAESLEISVAELIRRKLQDPPTSEEVLQLRQLKDFFKNLEARG